MQESPGPGMAAKVEKDMVPLRFRVVLEQLPPGGDWLSLTNFVAKEMGSSPSTIEKWLYWLEAESLLPVALWEGRTAKEATRLQEHLRRHGGQAAVLSTPLCLPLQKSHYSETAALFDSLKGASWTAL